jgi:hypothetical protein
MPRDRTGALINSGERVPGETFGSPLEQFYRGAPNYTVEEVMWAHHRNLFSPRRSRPSPPCFNSHRSLRRI